jgi:hypothetical protein
LFKGVWFESSYFNLNDLNNKPIVEGKNFYYREFIVDGVYVALDEVLYKLNPNDIGFPISKFSFIPKLYVTEGVVPTLSREQLILNEYTKGLIKEKFKLVLEELETYRVKYDHLYEFLNNSDNEKFKLTDSLTVSYGSSNYSSVHTWCSVSYKIPLNIEVPQGYKFNKFNFFNAFETVVNVNSGRIGPKVRVYSPKLMQYEEFSRGMKEYLRTNYEGLQIVRKPHLKLVKVNYRTSSPHLSLFYHLDLTNTPKDKWRPLIEWYIKELEIYWNSIEPLPVQEFMEWKASQVVERVTRKRERKQRVAKEELEYGYYSFRKRTKIPLIAGQADKVHPHNLKIYCTDETANLDKWHGIFEEFKFLYIPEKKVHLLEGLPNWIEISDFKKSKWFTKPVTECYWYVNRIQSRLPTFLHKKVKPLYSLRFDYYQQQFFSKFFQAEYFYKPLFDYYQTLDNIVKNYEVVSSATNVQTYILRKQNQRFKKLLNYD